MRGGGGRVCPASGEVALGQLPRSCRRVREPQIVPVCLSAIFLDSLATSEVRHGGGSQSRAGGLAVS